MNSLPFIVLSAVLFTPVGASAEDDHSKWYQCTSADECILAHGGCGGLTSINKGYSAEFETFLSKIKPEIECNRPPSDPPNAAAKCINGKCAVQ